MQRAPRLLLHHRAPIDIKSCKQEHEGDYVYIFHHVGFSPYVPCGTDKDGRQLYVVQFREGATVVHAKQSTACASGGRLRVNELYPARTEWRITIFPLRMFAFHVYLLSLC